MEIYSWMGPYISSSPAPCCHRWLPTGTALLSLFWSSSSPPLHRWIASPRPPTTTSRPAWSPSISLSFSTRPSTGPRTSSWTGSRGPESSARRPLLSALSTLSRTPWPSRRTDRPGLLGSSRELRSQPGQFTVISRITQFKKWCIENVRVSALLKNSSTDLKLCIMRWLDLSHVPGFPRLVPS